MLEHSAGSSLLTTARAITLICNVSKLPELRISLYPCVTYGLTQGNSRKWPLRRPGVFMGFLGLAENTKIMRNALTVDLEDYYHVSAFNKDIAREQWGFQEDRVERSTNLLLEWFSDAGHKATFFTLGWVTERHPNIVRRIAEQGHEIACHSLRHRTVYEMSQVEFREDTRRAKELLEDVTGIPVRGYRAPSFSITEKSLWALEVLAELGF